MHILNPAPSKGINYLYTHGHQLQDNGFRIIPVAARGKFPATPSHDFTKWFPLKDWQNLYNINPDFAAKWPESSIGIVTGHVVALDIDIMDADAVGMVKRLAIEKLGYTPLIRQGEAPKIIMVYRTDTPFGKHKSGKVEVLADGQQFVAYGIHPRTGKPYEWLNPDAEPTNTDVSELPLITEKQVIDFLDEISQKQLLIQKGFVGKVQTNAVLNGAPPEPVDKTRLIGSPEAVASAVEAIPNDTVDWDKFKRMGMLIFTASAGQDWGFEIFSRWAMKLDIPGRYALPEDAWMELRRSPPKRSGGANSLYYKARTDHGWRGEWVFPNAPNLDHIMDGFKPDKIAKNRAQLSTLTLVPAVNVPQPDRVQPNYTMLQSDGVASSISCNPLEVNHESNVVSFPSGKSVLPLTLSEARKRAQESPLAIATQREDQKIKALVASQEAELAALWERLSGPTSRYTVLSRVRDAMPQSIPEPLATAAGLQFLSALLSSST